MGIYDTVYNNVHEYINFEKQTWGIRFNVTFRGMSVTEWFRL